MGNACGFTFYCAFAVSLRVHLKIYFSDCFVCFLEAVKLSLTFLQPIDVLRVHSQQQAFVMEHADEVVYVVGPVAARIQSLGQGEERLRVVGEVVNVENSFWVRDVVPLQVSVKTRSWSSEKVRTF